jgi:hypothetical protein
MESHVPAGVAVVRVMPNTPALVDEGMAAISGGTHCDEAHLAEAEDLMASVGKVIRVPEKQQDAVTAISGSGPAYIFYVVESMIEAGVHLGLPRTAARDLVVQTLYGAATMIKETGEHPTVLREQVTSPGGTTASAIRELEVHKVRAAFLAALRAAGCRKVQLLSPKHHVHDGASPHGRASSVTRNESAPREATSHTCAPAPRASSGAMPSGSTKRPDPPSTASKAYATGSLAPSSGVMKPLWPVRSVLT